MKDLPIQRQKETIFSDQLKTIFSEMMKEVENKAINDPLYQYFLQRIDDFDSAYTVDMQIVRPFKNIIETVAKNKWHTDDGMVMSMYVDYSFYNSNIRILIEDIYGNYEVAGKAKHILQNALAWRLTGNLPDYDSRSENALEPETGTGKQWMEFVEGLYRLRYGYREEYLRAYQALVRTKKKNDRSRRTP